MIKFGDLTCEYKYVLEMAPVQIKVKNLYRKIVEKKEKFLKGELEFFLSCFFYDDNGNRYMMYGFDFDNGLKGAKYFWRNLKGKWHLEIISERTCHLVSNFVFLIDSELSVSMIRKLVYDNLKGNYDPRGSIPAVPFRRFPGRMKGRKEPIICIDNYRIRDYDKYTTNERNFEKYLDKYLFNIKVLKKDPLKIFH